MGLNTVDINVFSSTFTNVFFYFCHVFTFLTFLKIFSNVFFTSVVFDVGRNLVQDNWTADGEIALPELSPC